MVDEIRLHKIFETGMIKNIKKKNQEDNSNKFNKYTNEKSKQKNKNTKNFIKDENYNKNMKKRKDYVKNKTENIEDDFQGEEKNCGKIIDIII